MDEAFEQSEELFRQLDSIGISKGKFYKLAGVHHQLMNRRALSGQPFKIQEKLWLGSALEQIGGDPVAVWPNYREILHSTNYRPVKLNLKAIEYKQRTPKYFPPVEKPKGSKAQIRETLNLEKEKLKIQIERMQEEIKKMQSRIRKINQELKG